MTLSDRQRQWLERHHEDGRSILRVFGTLEQDLVKERELSETRKRHINQWERSYGAIYDKNEKYWRVIHHVRSVTETYLELDDFDNPPSDSRLEALHASLLLAMRQAHNELMVRDSEPEAEIPKQEG